jgi:excisionase family DNA binding protein
VTTDETSGLLDVRHAAAHVRRHPETVRRWVWSGRLNARRVGRRLLVATADVEALAGMDRTRLTLADWAAEASRNRTRVGNGAVSAADLVLEDRAARSGAAERRARR